MAVLDFWLTWPIVLVYGAAAIFFVNLIRSRQQIFRLLTIVKDLNAMNLRPISFAVLGCLTVINTLIRGLFI